MERDNMKKFNFEVGTESEIEKDFPEWKELSRFGFVGAVFIRGQRVEIRRLVHCMQPVSDKIEVFYNAYVKIEDASPKWLKKVYDCDSATFEESGWLGVDTGHAWNKDQSDSEKIEDALNQITDIIDDFFTIRV